MVFYYYYDQLCKAINSSPHVTRKVTDTYGKIMHFTTDRNNIYLEPRAKQGGDRHIGYYRMTQEYIEQVIKDQPKIWVEKPEKEKKKGKEKEKEKEKGKGKKKEIELEKDKEEVKEIDKGKASIGEKQTSTTDIGNSSIKKRKISKLTYHAVLHKDDFESIADRAYGTMSELITTITTAQEVLKQTIETQLTELKTLVSHAPQVATPYIVQSIVMDPEGNQHRFISVTLISICRPSAQEGL